MVDGTHFDAQTMVKAKANLKRNLLTKGLWLNQMIMPLVKLTVNGSDK